MNSSAIGQLLKEISWEGKGVKSYRDGGLGRENVLTAEVFQALDFLPREDFFGEVVLKSHLIRETTQVADEVISEIDSAEFILLPGNYYLRPSENSHFTGIGVQPDVLVESEKSSILIEAKRIRSGSAFNKQQLAREFVLVTRESKQKKPFLLLVLKNEPPIKVSGAGIMEIREAILKDLKEVYEQTEGHHMEYEQLVDLIDTSVAWVTWDQINSIVKEQVRKYDVEQPVNRTIQRLVESINESIERHS